MSHSKSRRDVARRLKKFNFPTRRGTYDWDKWADGSIWELRQGEDFEDTDRFVMAAYQFRKRMGLRLHMARDGDTVTLRFINEESA